jgi:hypothetical protein
MKEKRERAMEEESGSSAHPSAMELLRMMSGRSKHPDLKERVATDSILAVFKDRFTYTFILNDEVSSIHFDRNRGEIFFKGHNINYMELSVPQRTALVSMEEILEADDQGKKLSASYAATLSRLLADKYK